MFYEDEIINEILNDGAPNVKASDFGENKIDDIRRSLEDSFGPCITYLFEDNKLCISKTPSFDLERDGQNVIWLNPEYTSPENAPRLFLEQLGNIGTRHDISFVPFMHRIWAISPVIMENALKAKDPVADLAKTIFEKYRKEYRDRDTSNFLDKTKSQSHHNDLIFRSLLAACCYENLDIEEGGLARWFSNVKNKVNVCLFKFGFKDVSRLKPMDLFRVIESRVREFAKGEISIVGDQTFINSTDLAYASTLYAIEECGLPKSLRGKFLAFTEKHLLSGVDLKFSSRETYVLKENIRRCVKEIKNKVIEIGKVSSVNTEVHKAIGGVER